MKKNVCIFIVLNCLVLGIGSTAFSETITKQIYLDKNNTIWVTVDVWRDGGKVYAEFTPSEDITNIPVLEWFYLWDFTIEQDDKEYREFDDFSFYDEENEFVWKVEDQSIKTQIKTIEDKDVPEDIQGETDLDLNKAFLLKYDGYYHDYTLSINAKSSGGGGGGCFINSSRKH